MSIVKEINQYLIRLQQTDHISLFMALKYNCLYFLDCFKTFIFYVISFRWVWDFVQYPICIPDWENSNLKEIFTFQNPSNFLLDYQFSEIQFPAGWIFIISFFSSAFFWFPHSSIQFLILRRLVVEGVPAGIMAAAGTLIAQLFVLMAILWGFRIGIWGWLNLESYIYLLTLVFIFILIYNLCHRSIKRLRWSNKRALLEVFIINFCIVGFENYGVFPYFNSLSTSESLGFVSSEQAMYYIIGFGCGSVFWILVFGYLILRISDWCTVHLTKSYSAWIQRTNFICLSIILSFCIASFPYYGLDYLFLSSLGFYSQDSALPFTELKTDLRDVQKGRLGEYSAHSSVDTDLAPYDRGRYSTGNEIELTFEDMNFQGEYIWRSRADRLASGSAGIVNQFMSKFLPTSSKQQPTEPPDMSVNQENTPPPDSLEFLYTHYNFESVLDRFLADYNAEVQDVTIPESMIDTDQFSAFSELAKYGFDSFASLDDADSDEIEEELGKKIKLKYYRNPVYKAILSLDIQNFLGRQPKSHFLTSKQENELFQQKQILFKYYNSLLAYSRLPYKDIFLSLFGETKSYANRVYNQQYKGTLKILRRLFLVDYTQNESQKSVLHFDQILFNDINPNYKHEEVKPTTKKRSSVKRKNRFIRESRNLPFYMGWDSQKRQLVLTNRFLTKQKVFHSTALNWPAETTRIVFTSWPFEIDNPKGQFMFYKFDQAQSDLQRDLFEYIEIGEYETQMVYDTLPSIIKRVDLRNKDKSLIDLKPSYGAFVWVSSPGNQQPN